MTDLRHWWEGYWGSSSAVWPQCALRLACLHSRWLLTTINQCGQIPVSTRHVLFMYVPSQKQHTLPLTSSRTGLVSRGSGSAHSPGVNTTLGQQSFSMAFISAPSSLASDLTTWKCKRVQTLYYQDKAIATKLLCTFSGLEVALCHMTAVVHQLTSSTVVQ